MALESFKSQFFSNGAIGRRSQTLVVLLLLQVAVPLFLVAVKSWQDIGSFANMNFKLSVELMVVVTLPITLASIWVARELISLALREAEIKETERFAFLGRLSSALAHEVRNPGTAVVGFLQLIDRSLEPGANLDRDQARNWIKIARAEMERIMTLVAEFLMLSRSDRKAPGQVDLSRVAREVVEAMGPKAAAKRIELNFSSADSFSITGNDQGLRQAVMNLVINALESTQPGGRVEVQIRPSSTGDSVAMAVRDTGIGIEPQNLPMIFEPFFTTRESGTGLGLAISQKIVRDHGGTITVDSRPGYGATFTVNLPVTNEIVSNETGK